MSVAGQLIWTTVRSTSQTSTMLSIGACIGNWSSQSQEERQISNDETYNDRQVKQACTVRSACLPNIDVDHCNAMRHLTSSQQQYSEEKDHDLERLRRGRYSLFDVVDISQILDSFFEIMLEWTIWRENITIWINLTLLFRVESRRAPRLLYHRLRTGGGGCEWKESLLSQRYSRKQVVHLIWRLRQLFETVLMRELQVTWGEKRKKEKRNEKEIWEKKEDIYQKEGSSRRKAVSGIWEVLCNCTFRPFPSVAYWWVKGIFGQSSPYRGGRSITNMRLWEGKNIGATKGMGCWVQIRRNQDGEWYNSAESVQVKIFRDHPQLVDILYR